jgi:CRP-like cAMP-binding protein
MRLINLSDDGVEHTRMIATTGDIVGFEALVQEPVRIHSVIARQTSSLCSVASCDLSRTFGDHSDVRLGLLAQICALLLRAEQEHVACLDGTVKTRVRRVAQMLASRFVEAERMSGCPIATLTQRELAGLLSVAEETVSRTAPVSARLPLRRPAGYPLYDGPGRER